MGETKSRYIISHFDYRPKRIIMPAIPYVKKRIGNSYLVWLQNSNLYFQLEEPAWFVFHKTVKRHKTTTIVRMFIERYGSTAEESIRFVEEIRNEIFKMNQVKPALNNELKSSEFLNSHDFIPWSIHHYRLGLRSITFSYESRLFEHYLHPLICHLETSGEINEHPLFELFAHHEQIVFRYNGVVTGVWSKEETHLVKGQIFMFLINVMYDKTDADWLMTVHASAITNGKKTMLFSAAPGNGKTTIAALLQAQGYRLISDDFVPIERSTFCAYPFPIAMSVKEGAQDLLSALYPALEQKSLNYISPEKSVRYLAPDFDPDFATEIYPVHEFIFIQYNRSVDFVWEKLDPLMAMKLLLEEAWVAPTAGNAALLFDRISELSFFHLSYSNNSKALETISNLFNIEQNRSK